MTALHRRTVALVRQTEAEIQALGRLYRMGRIPRSVFVSAAAAAIARARALGASLADLSVAVNLSRQLGSAVSPLGIGLGDEVGRLMASVETVLGQEIAYATTFEELTESQLLRLGRLSRDATAEAVVIAAGLAMRGHGAGGWVRRTGARPCPLCTRWADGRVRPPSMEMIRHTGCNCVQQVIAAA